MDSVVGTLVGTLSGTLLGGVIGFVQTCYTTKKQFKRDEIKRKHDETMRIIGILEGLYPHVFKLCKRMRCDEKRYEKYSSAYPEVGEYQGRMVVSSTLKVQNAFQNFLNIFDSEVELNQKSRELQEASAALGEAIRRELDELRSKL